MVEDEEYEEYEEPIDEQAEDEVEEQMEDSAEQQQDIMEDLAPSPIRKDDLYSLFWKVIKIQDSSKVGHLSKEELGMFNISVRDLQKIKLLSYALGHKHFGDFWAKQAEIVLATSSSKDGWLPELFVSSKQQKTKSRRIGVNSQNLLNQSQPRRGLFKWRN
jgi:hypothetical protein